MLRKLIVTSMAMSATTAAFTQDSTSNSPLTVSGSADVYYRYDFSKQRSNNYTSFTNSHNSFELGMASVKLTYKVARVELVADLGFGKRAKEFSYNDEDFLSAIKQLYVSYNPAQWLKLTAGSWATHVGYELVDAAANRNYSMSYMFTNGPFFHTGLKAEATYKSSGFMLGLANPTDFKYVPGGVMNKKVVLAQYSFVPSDKFKLYANFVGGDNIDTTKTVQYDVVMTSKLSDKFSIAYNGTLNRTRLYLGLKEFDNTKTWWGSAVYINLEAGKNVGLKLREEYFSDENQLKLYSAIPAGGHIYATTLSANLRKDGFILIPEIRYDRSSAAIFSNKSGGAVKGAANILLAAIYQF